MEALTPIFIISVVIFVSPFWLPFVLLWRWRKLILSPLQFLFTSGMASVSALVIAILGINSLVTLGIRSYVPVKCKATFACRAFDLLINYQMGFWLLLYILFMSGFVTMIRIWHPRLFGFSTQKNKVFSESEK